MPIDGGGPKRSVSRRAVIAALVMALLSAVAIFAPDRAVTPGSAAVSATPPQGPAGLEANSTQAVCALTGDHGAYVERPTHYTVHRYGLISGDSGSSFEFDGKVWWLFGNTGASKHQPWGLANITSRWPAVKSPPFSATTLGSDSIATSSEATPPPNPAVAYTGSSVPPDQQCPELHFISVKPQAKTTAKSSAKATSRKHDAYLSPSVVPDPLFPTAQDFVSLRRGELPEAGISEGDPARMYVVFGTDNHANCLSVSMLAVDGPCPQGANVAPTTICGSQKGSRTRSVMAMYLGRSASFEGLYDLSAPPARYGPNCPTAPAADPARFVNVQLQNGNDGYVYIWGTEGGANNEHSPIYLARMLEANIATGAGIEYWDGKDSPGRFVAGSQASATPLFDDHPDPCAAQMGVQYNRYLGEWIILYHCKEAHPPAASPNGIYMRTAPDPWGPWSAPTTIFNPAPDPRTASGYCYFIYSAQPCPSGSPEANHEVAGARGKQSGSYYGPYFVANWTTGTAATATRQASTTIYYTLDTFNPYGQLILRSTILGPPVQSGGAPGCKGNACG